VSRASIRIRIRRADILELRTDVLILKHAQALYGADAAVYDALGGAQSGIELPKEGEHELVLTNAAIGASRVLFVGVEPLRGFAYAQIRDFARRALSILAGADHVTRRLALTLHGAGYGLDEIESFESELAGLLDAIAQNEYPAELEEIIFVERDESRAKRISAALNRLMPSGVVGRPDHGPLTGLDKPAKQALRTAGYGSASKPRVFVAMPFAKEMDDVFHYGIQGAVNSAGLLAERADMAAFVGDVMEWVKDRISGAKLVIADLTDSNPNVFLEVGFAWGKGVPTVLLSKSASDLKFDVRGQRCIIYSSIKELEEKLSAELGALLSRRM
jgi:hypothetical protein